MLESLNHFDHELFLKINHFRNSFFDVAMPLISGRWLWIPLYVILAFILWKRFGKQFIMILAIIGTMIFVTDQSANLLKNNICRFRPCHEVGFSEQVILSDGCGGEYGFVSGHAANTFAIATFLWLLSGMIHGFAPTKKRKLWLWLFGWSILICWSRIYVGVHFPFDLLGGCFIGAIWGIIMFILYKKVIPVLK